MAVGVRVDPFLAHAFAVEFDGLVVGGFAEVSGLVVETEVFEYREGGVNDHMHRLPGPLRHPGNILLRRGLTDVHSLWTWQYEIGQGTISRRNGSIVLLDAGVEAIRWNFTGGYPVRWSGPDLRASGGTVALETLEIAHAGLSMSPGS
ncbi:MAG: phage tail protein [Solirubrobacteraceae bacterium]